MDFKQQLKEIQEYGIVTQVSHPIVIVKGLENAHLHEMVLFESGEMGEVFLIHQDSISVLVFSKHPINVGLRVTRTDESIAVPVGHELLGKIIDPLGNSISEEKEYAKPHETRILETHPLGITKRLKITESFLTGVALIDTMIPLGKGQKELIIGDRKTGKTSILLASMKHQIMEGSIAIYAAIGKKRTDIKKIEQSLTDQGIEKSALIVATTSYDSPSLIFLTPFTAMTIAEYFRDKGRNVVVIFDDLSTHARFYREISLLAKRFPGRDSYPGDIFYTHARLLERAGNFKHGEEGKSVSITAFPIAEITEGDFTGYIPTNLMGMTDGHIFFDSNVYYKGRRPAINVALSVTRVGRQTQSPLARSINRELTTFLALYEKMQNLSHFGAELTDTVKQVLSTGGMIYNYFNQDYFVVIPQTVQLVLFALVWLNLIPDVETLVKARKALLEAYKNDEHKKFLDDLARVESLNPFLTRIQESKEELLSLSHIGDKSPSVPLKKPIPVIEVEEKEEKKS